MWRPWSSFRFTLLRISHIQKLKICLEKQSLISVFFPCVMFVNRLQEAIPDVKGPMKCASSEYRFLGASVLMYVQSSVSLSFSVIASEPFVSAFISCLSVMPTCRVKGTVTGILYCIIFSL